MGAPLPRPAALNARLETPVEEWPYLDEGTLLKTRSRKVCMTCQLHQGWTDGMTRQRGWAPEVA